MPEYESFAAADRALQEFAGWEMDRGLRPMTPHERGQATQLLKDRRADVAQRGKDALAVMRKGVQERGAAVLARYEAAEALLDALDDDLDAGTVTVSDLESALADAAMMERGLGKLADSHLTVASQVEKDVDPETFIRDLYRRYPNLGRDGRQSPWVFPW